MALGGGSFSSAGGPLLAASRLNDGPTYENNYFGFRVAEVPGQPPDGVATVSEWDVLMMMLVVLTAGTLVFHTRRPVLT